MPILDSEFFPSGSGGAMAKPYISGMTVKYEDVVRSAKNRLPFIRKKSTPASLVITSDPADLFDDFIVDDTSTAIGSIKSLPDGIPATEKVIKHNGQTWLKTGAYLPLSTLGYSVPSFCRVYYDLWYGIFTPAQVGMSGTTIVDVVGNGTGSWMAVNSAGTLFRSTSDGASWETIPGITTTADAKLATNGTGRWWLCSNTGQVYVTDNFGANWTAQQSPGTVKAAVFAFMDGKLWYAPATTYTISAASGTLSIVVSLPDTNSTSQSWTGYFYNVSAASPTFPYNTTALVRGAASNNKGTIWFVGTASNNYLSIFTLNTTTGTFNINTMGAADALNGICYDEVSDLCWFHCVYGYLQNSNNYEIALNSSGSIVSSGTNTIIPNGTYEWYPSVDQRSQGNGAGYLRKGASALAFLRNYTNSVVFFKFSGMTMTSGRVPAVSGNLYGYQFLGLKQAGNTTLLYGNCISRSEAAVGLPTPIFSTAGKLDYLRIS